MVCISGRREREQIRKEYVYSRRRKQTNVKKKSAWIIRKIFLYKYIKKINKRRISVYV